MSEVVYSAVNSIKINKLRAFLTMLGVIIGVFSVVSMLAFGVGIQNFISERFSSLGSNLLLVTPGRLNFRADPASSFSANKLEKKHADLIKRYAGSQIISLTPSVRSSAKLEHRTQEYFGTIAGINEDGQLVSGFDVSSGRYFSAQEVKSKRKVGLIGVEAKKELFGDAEPVGKFVKIDGDSYEIIGTIAEKNQTYDQGITVPFTAAQETLGINNISSIAVKMKNDSDTRKTKKFVEMALLRDLGEDDFSVVSQTELLESFQSILRLLTAGLGVIAGISLLVGGIGIMNIMLVSVTERTREIGLRKAVGATPRNIVLQFLSESVLISVTGGLIGILLAFLLTFAVRSLIDASVPLYAVLIAFFFSVGVGVLFGTYPAVKAGKKDPIQALVYE
jgi:putative ABC transport system permease protein